MRSGPAAEEATMTWISQVLNSQGQHFATLGLGLTECYSSVLCIKTTATLWEITSVLVGLLSHPCERVTR